MDHDGHAKAHAGDSCNGRPALFHHRLNFSLDFSIFIIQFPDKPEVMLQFQECDRYPWFNGFLSSVPDSHSHIPTIATFGVFFSKEVETCQAYLGNLLSAGKLFQQGVDSRQMEHRLFRFWETVCRPSWKLNFSAWSALSLYQNGILSVTVVPHCGSWICVGVEAHTGWQHSSNGSSIHTVSLGLSQPETFPVEVRAKEI